MSRLFTVSIPFFEKFSQLSENNSVLLYLTIKYLLFFYSVKVIVAKARRINDARLGLRSSSVSSRYGV